MIQLQGKHSLQKGKRGNISRHNTKVHFTVIIIIIIIIILELSDS